MLVLFLALVVGPAVAGDKIPVDFGETLAGLPFRLVQPNNLENDNTNSSSLTGTGAPDYTYPSGYLKSTDEGGRATDKIKLF